VIQLIDQALEQYLRAVVPLPESAVDISFAAPDKTWGKAVTRPSVNLFLWDVKRSAPLAQTGVIEQAADGRVVRRPPLPTIDLNYFVTAWAAEERDEHQLLGSVLTTILATSELPQDYVPEQFRGLTPVSVDIATSAQRKPGDFVSILDGQLKPGLEVKVTLELDIIPWREAGPPTEVIEVGVGRAAPSVAAPDAAATGINGTPRPVRRRRSGSVVVEGRREAPVEEQQ